MSNNILDFGKNKGHQISECDTKYLKWLVSHEKVLAVRNRWASRDAKFEIERRARAAQVDAQIAEMVAAPKQTYRIITVPGPKKEYFDLVGHITEKRELKAAMLGEIAEIKSRSKRSADLGLAGNLSSNQGFRLMR